jgi:hypothetical protein
LAHNRPLLKRLGKAARQRMAGISWDAAFEKTYAAYRYCLPDAAQTLRAPEKIEIAQA